MDVKSSDKAKLELYRQKICQKIESDPVWAQKAAVILIEMLGQERGSQK